jgi:hypothetical protein
VVALVAVAEVPKWAQKVSYLRAFAKGRHLVSKSGGKFRVVFLGVTEPIGERWVRPLKLQWDEATKMVTAQFNFVQDWVVLEYHRGVKGFVYHAPSSSWDLVFQSHPDATYYVGEAREETSQKIKERRTWRDDEQENLALGLKSLRAR